MSNQFYREVHNIVEQLDDEQRKDLAIHLYCTYMIRQQHISDRFLRKTSTFPPKSWSKWPLQLKNVPGLDTTAYTIEDMGPNRKFYESIDPESQQSAFLLALNAEFQRRLLKKIQSANKDNRLVKKLAAHKKVKKLDSTSLDIKLGASLSEEQYARILQKLRNLFNVIVCNLNKKLPETNSETARRVFNWQAILLHHEPMDPKVIAKAYRLFREYPKLVPGIIKDSASFTYIDNSTTDHYEEAMSYRDAILAQKYKISKKKRKLDESLILCDDELAEVYVQDRIPAYTFKKIAGKKVSP